MKTWTEFDEKYRSTIGEIAKGNPVGENDQADLGTAREMLIYMAENENGTTYKGVPSGFDWKACLEDCTSIREAIKAGN